MANTTQPELIVIMGVACSGKSTLARALSETLGWQYVEADDFHSSEAVAHMQSGKPLTDAMREPWMKKLCSALTMYSGKGRSCVMAWSGLRKAHREKIRNLPCRQVLCLLEIDEDTAKERIEKRSMHFMNKKLVKSQFEAMQLPDSTEQTVFLDGTLPTEALITQVTNLLQDQH